MQHGVEGLHRRPAGASDAGGRQRTTNVETTSETAISSSTDVLPVHSRGPLCIKRVKTTALFLQLGTAGAGEAFGRPAA